MCQHNHTSIVNVTNYRHTVVGNESALQAALIAHGPIAVAMDASQGSFASYSGGVYSDSRCGNTKDALDHAVLLIGYGVAQSAQGAAEEYWLVKNSWGTGWGEEGFFRIARNKNDMCGLAIDASFPIVA